MVFYSKLDCVREKPADLNAGWGIELEFLVCFSAFGGGGGTNESSVSRQVAILMVTLYRLPLTSPVVLPFFFPTQFEKEADRQAFDVLKVDGWRVLTLHSTVKIEQDIWRDWRGEEETALLNSLSPSLSWKQAKLGPSAGPVNDAVLPSG